MNDDDFVKDILKNIITPISNFAKLWCWKWRIKPQIYIKVLSNFHNVHIFLQGGRSMVQAIFPVVPYFFSKISLVPSRHHFSEIKSQNFPIVPSRRPFSENSFFPQNNPNFHLFSLKRPLKQFNYWFF